MVDPYAITDFSRSRASLEEFWLFCLAVAGKKATMISGKLEEFLSQAIPGETPFEYVRRLAAEDRLRERLLEVRMGKYALLVPAFSASAAHGAPDISDCTVEALEALPGVGPKTARFFVVHSRPGARVAVIDTHVLKFLRDRGHDVPKGFPDRRAYARLEGLMLAEIDASGMEPAAFDLMVWSHYASGGASPLPDAPAPALAA